MARKNTKGLIGAKNTLSRTKLTEEQTKRYLRRNGLSRKAAIHLRKEKYGI